MAKCTPGFGAGAVDSDSADDGAGAGADDGTDDADGLLGVVDGESRGPKIRVFMKKRRKGSRRTRGHRATYTRVRITGIEV